MTISECTRNIPCIDCDNTACFHHGKKESDCPKYHCDRQGDGFMNCEHCGFIDRFIQEERQHNKEAEGMTSDEKAVFHVIANCELSSYSTLYAPDKVVVSTGDIAKMCLWSKYRTRKAIKRLVEKGLIERASCGCPAVVSYGEYQELVCEARPPMNGYAITKQGFQSEEWKSIYDLWCRSMEEWANMPLEESEDKG